MQIIGHFIGIIKPLMTQGFRIGSSDLVCCIALHCSIAWEQENLIPKRLWRRYQGPASCDRPERGSPDLKGILSVRHHSLAPESPAWHNDTTELQDFPGLSCLHSNDMQMSPPASKTHALGRPLDKNASHGGSGMISPRSWSEMRLDRLQISVSDDWVFRSHSQNGEKMLWGWGFSATDSSVLWQRGVRSSDGYFVGRH